MCETLDGSMVKKWTVIEKCAFHQVKLFKGEDLRELDMPKL